MLRPRVIIAAMQRALAFEQEILERLDLVPLVVRRKLDLAELKVSLAGWAALDLADRRALRDLPVTDDASVGAFAGALRNAAARAGVGLDPIADERAAWRSATVPGPVLSRLAEIGVALGADTWRALDDDARYVLVKLAGKRREPERFALAVKEILG